MAVLERTRERLGERVEHYAVYHRPLHHTLTQLIGDSPRELAVSRNRDACSFGVPLHYNPGDKEKDALVRAVCDRLHFDDPDVTWRLHGRKPEVVFTRKELLPGFLTWADVERLVKAAKPDQLLSGLGKSNVEVFVSTKLDSPHFGIAMGTGGGKSNTAAFWLTQELMRGAVGLILDAKWISHPWAFKDIDANYGQLPNIAYARSTADLHNAMVWLGIELQRRTEAAELLVNSKGDILGDVGPTLWIIAEELNLAVPRLKQYWATIRDPKTDPKRSPALDGMAAVSFAGRAVRMHLIVIGQMLTAAVLGGGDVRENIGVRMLARYTGNSWKMQAGDLPMPPSSDIPGRVQVVASGTVREAQVPLMDLDKCREYAIAGDVTECPDGMPGIGDVARVALPPTPSSASDMGFVVRQGIPPGRPPGTMTLREATTEGLFTTVGAARRAVQRRGLDSPGSDGAAKLYFISDLASMLRSDS